jgi:hypothetical protein
MAANPLIAFRASPEIKAGLHSLAEQRNPSDSAFLQRLVELVVHDLNGLLDRCNRKAYVLAIQSI